MVSDLLRDFEFTAVLQIRRDAGRAESMIANSRFDAGCFRTPADDAVGVLLEEGIGCNFSFSAGGKFSSVGSNPTHDTPNTFHEFASHRDCQSPLRFSNRPICLDLRV
jgi:hypothetical protein